MTGFPKPTARLSLNHLHGHDNELREIVGWLNDPAVVRFSEQRHIKHTIASQYLYFDSVTRPNIYIGVYNEGCLIGTLSVLIDERNNIANVGIMMGDKSKWGVGYGLEAWIGVCDELFALGIRKVEAGCMAVNYRMMAICQHYGMVEEGRQDEHFILDEGSPAVDLVHWGKFNETS
jgi:[ribosomal protein S5]-alanine N-acetyltransferase